MAANIYITTLNLTKQQYWHPLVLYAVLSTVWDFRLRKKNDVKN